MGTKTVINTYETPINLEFTDGKTIHHHYLPARRRVNISVGFYLTKEAKARWPNIIDTEDSGSTQTSVNSTEYIPVGTIPADKENSVE